MIRTLVVADSGDVMAGITARLAVRHEIELVAYASGRSPIAGVVRQSQPDVVLVDEMSWVGLALARMAEVQEVAPLAAIVGLTDHPDADWIIDGLRAGATTIVPRELEPPLLAQVLHEAVASVRTPAVAATHRRAA